jgi:cell division protein FtsZ
VTVIVTGLGRKQPHGSSVKLIDSTRADGSIDYNQLEKPAVMRRHASSAAGTHAPQKPILSTDSAHELDYLDIPAFLRRKEEVEV